MSKPAGKEHPANLPGRMLEVQFDDVLHRAAMQRDDSGRMTAHIDGSALLVDAYEIAPGVLSLLIDGRAFRCVLVEAGEERAVALRGGMHRIAVVDPRSLRAQRLRASVAGGATEVKATMPGRVARVLVAAGDTVEAQQGVVVIEAMKMQNELKAARAGQVVEVRVAAGDTVTSGQVLAVLE